MPDCEHEHCGLPLDWQLLLDCCDMEAQIGGGCTWQLTGAGWILSDTAAGRAINVIGSVLTVQLTGSVSITQVEEADDGCCCDC